MSTVASHWRLWCQRGVWQEAVLVLGPRWREVSLGRGRRAPRPAILDRQSVKAAAEGQARGFPGGKKVKGRSRPVAVDRQGTLLAVHATAANKAAGAEAAVMVQAAESHPSPESFTADQSYQRQAEAAARELLGRDRHVTARDPQKEGFVPVALRRRVERALARFGPCRLLCKADEKTVASSEAWLWCAMLRLPVRRLSCQPPRF